MLRVGITGGVGMGKSTSGNWLSQNHLPVIDTDDIARELTRPDGSALDEIRRAFGADVFDSPSTLNRAALAKLIFNDSRKRKALESILHPKIRASWTRRLDQFEVEGHHLAFVTIPLLFEVGAESDLDAIVCIVCSANAQNERLANRGWSTEQAAARIRAQLPITEKQQRAHFVLWSEGAPESLDWQWRHILDQLRTHNS